MSAGYRGADSSKEEGFIIQAPLANFKAPQPLIYVYATLHNKRTECEPSQFGSSREQSSRDKGSSSMFRKCMSTVNWNMFRMCISIVD